MKPVLSVIGVVLALTFILDAAPPALVTRPAVPDQAALNHLGLKRRWFTYVPMEGIRDRVLHAQFLHDQLVLQTAAGRVIALAGESGETQVELLFGRPFLSQRERAAANDGTLFVAVDTRLYGIDRYSGRQAWQLKLPGMLSTGPTADNQQLLICTKDGGLYAYQVPRPVQAGPAPTEAKESPSTAAKTPEAPIREPEYQWVYRDQMPISPPPVTTESEIIFADPSGVLNLLARDRKVLGQFVLDAAVTGPFGQTDRMIIVSARDTNLYGFEIGFDRFELRWRSVVGGKTVTRPMTVGDDVYVAPIGMGLICLDRHSGGRRWQFGGVEEFLAASKRMVFAADGHGDIIVLDRGKGKFLGKWAARGFAHRVANEFNDRLYLVNHDGLVVCLHDLDKAHEKPVYHSRPEKAPAAAAADKEKPAEEKGVEEQEKPKVDKKEEEKKE